MRGETSNPDASHWHHVKHIAQKQGPSKKAGNTTNLLRNGPVFKVLYTPLNPPSTSSGQALLLEGTCLPPNKEGLREVFFTMC